MGKPQTRPPLLPIPVRRYTATVLGNPFAPGGERLLKNLGFAPMSPEESKELLQPTGVGLFKWKGRWLEVSRSEWAFRRDAILKIKA